MSIRLDKSPTSALATCTSCPPWRVLRGTREAALLAAADHVQLTHDDHRAASKLRDRARNATRRADTPAE